MLSAAVSGLRGLPAEGRSCPLLAPRLRGWGSADVCPSAARCVVARCVVARCQEGLAVELWSTAEEWIPPANGSLLRPITAGQGTGAGAATVPGRAAECAARAGSAGRSCSASWGEPRRAVAAGSIRARLWGSVVTRCGGAAEHPVSSAVPLLPRGENAVGPSEDACCRAHRRSGDSPACHGTTSRSWLLLYSHCCHSPSWSWSHGQHQAGQCDTDLLERNGPRCPEPVDCWLAVTCPVCLLM